MYFKLINYIHFCTTFFYENEREHDGEGTSPPRHVLVSFLTRRGGIYPSSSRSCHFNTMGRAPALPVVFKFPFWCDKEGGAYPLLVMFFLFQRDEEGRAPSSLCRCSHFDVTGPFHLGTIGRVPPSLSCPFCSHFDATRRDTPSLSHYFHFIIKIVQNVCN